MCKTGTAQHGGEEAKPHAWMVVVIPRGIPPVVGGDGDA